VSATVVKKRKAVVEKERQLWQASRRKRKAVLSHQEGSHGKKEGKAESSFGYGCLRM